METISNLKNHRKLENIARSLMWTNVALLVTATALAAVSITGLFQSRELRRRLEKLEQGAAEAVPAEPARDY